jgi:guanylate kinase
VPGHLIVVSGPSGAGKGTLVKEVLPRVPDLCLSISATTRPPRAGEEEGVDYFFVDAEEFDRMMADGGLLEWAGVHGNRYGTPKASVDKAVAAGKTVLLEIDVQGADQVRALRPDTHLVFVTAPSLEDLKQRMKERGAESEEQVRGRLERAREELQLAGRYEHVIVNDDVSRAARELETTIRRIMEEQ